MQWNSACVLTLSIVTLTLNSTAQCIAEDDPTCEGCLEEVESATYILCDCEAIAYLRFRHLGQFFIEPSDYYDAPINRDLHFIRSAELIKGSSKGKHNRSVMVAVQGPNYYGPPFHIHSFMYCRDFFMSDAWIKILHAIKIILILLYIRKVRH
jgi:hypothetical protein